MVGVDQPKSRYRRVGWHQRRLLGIQGGCISVHGIWNRRQLIAQPCIYGKPPRDLPLVEHEEAVAPRRHQGRDLTSWRNIGLLQSQNKVCGCIESKLAGKVKRSARISAGCPSRDELAKFHARHHIVFSPDPADLFGRLPNPAHALASSTLKVTEQSFYNVQQLVSGFAELAFSNILLEVRNPVRSRTRAVRSLDLRMQAAYCDCAMSRIIPAACWSGVFALCDDLKICLFMPETL